MTQQNIIHIVELGASVAIDCRCFSYNDLICLAKAAKASEAKMTLTHIVFSYEALTEVLKIAPRQFTLDFTDQSFEED